MSKDYAAPYEWNCICEICRKKVKSSEIRRLWNGLLVCSEDWEERHPLDYPRPPAKDDLPLPFTRPEPADVFITGVCTVSGRSAVVGYAVAGCSIVGYDINKEEIEMPLGTFHTTTL